MKPILFNTEMVKAILDGRKTQTRRIIKGLPLTEPHATVDEGRLWIEDEDGKFWRAEQFSRIQPGDVLYVRETWAKDTGRYMYRANYSDTEKFYMNGREIKMVWRPSIHMPKKAARLFLRVTNIRIERLQDITTEDALSEGIKDPYDYQEPIWYDTHKDLLNCAERASFAGMWETTLKPANLPRYGWDANPWVWVIGFVRIAKP